MVSGRLEEILKRELIWHGAEERYLEYKESMSWKRKETRRKIIKSILAFSNTRDGGYIVMGVEESNGSFKPVGMKPLHISTWSHDKMAPVVSEYADPHVRFIVDTHEEKGSTFLIISVAEFDEIPVVCRKEDQDLHRGRLYVRSRRMIASAEVQRESEMRDILDMALEKLLRRFRWSVGLIGAKAPAEEDEEKFEKELEGK